MSNFTGYNQTPRESVSIKQFIEQNSVLNLTGPLEEQPVKKKNKININFDHIELESCEQERLLDLFNKIKDDENLINKFNFRMEIIGTQVPDVISERFFCIFASVVSGQSNRIQQILNQENTNTVGNATLGDALPDKIDFSDLILCYFTLTNKRPQEIAQLCFEMLKLTKDQQEIGRDDLCHWCVRILQFNENLVNLFYKRSELDPRVPINKKEFCSVFPKIATIPFLELIPEVVGDYKSSYINFNPKIAMYNRRSTIAMTAIHIEDVAKASMKDFGTEMSDTDNIREYFVDEILGQSSDYVLRVYQKLFQDIKHQEVRNFLLDKITQYKANDFDFFTKLVGYTVTGKDFKSILSFWFDLANNFKVKMNQENCLSFCRLFQGQPPPPENFPMSKTEFVEFYENQQNLKGVESFMAAKFMMIGLMGIKNTGKHMEQHMAICAVLGQTYEEEYDLEKYIQQNLFRETTCYVINKRFWDSWSREPNKHHQVLDMIDNQSFILPGHQLRWKEDLIWNVDYIVVPACIYRPLSKWYKCNKDIELTAVIKPITQFNSLLTESDIDDLKLGEHHNTELDQNGGEARRTQTPKNQVRGDDDPSLLKMTNMSQMNVQEVIHETGLGQYNLQLYPRFLYFSKISKSGEFQHKQCLFNNKIDEGYMKKFVNSEKIPFEELSVSKFTKMETILEMVTAHYNVTSTKKARIIINDQIITGLKMQMTPEDLILDCGTLIYVEFLNFNNTWPSEHNTDWTNQGQQESSNEKKSSGLYNLGNTCYMNSALQCLANIKPFYEYYIRQRHFSVQININNPVGHKGQLVGAFASLLHQLWTSNQIIVPKYFRNTIGKINMAFGGDEQQDSVEYINFLIDGLHEDTNMRTDKPYFEAPNSDGKDTLELGLETWSNQIQRDWSFIYFMFYGQWQSTLQCLSCKKQSSKFDVSNTIALSMPEPSKLFLNIVVHRLPSNIKQIISPVSSPQESQQSGNDDRYKENYTKLTNNQPIYICIKVSKNIKVTELIRKIVAIPEVNIDPKQFLEQGFTDLMLYNKCLGKVRGIFDPNNKISQYKLITDEIHAQEVLTNRGKDYMMQMWQHNSGWISQTTMSMSYLIRDYQIYGKLYMEDRKPKKTPQFSMQYVFNNHFAACEMYEKLLNTQKFSPNCIVVAYHRRFSHKESRIFSQLQPSFVSSPIVLTVPLFPSGRRLYEEIWMMAQILLRKDSKFLNPDEQRDGVLWWTDLTSSKELMTEAENKGTLQPFVLKYVDRQGYNCSKCNWTAKCSGCIVDPNEQRIPEFIKYSNLVIEWDSDMIGEFYDSTVNEMLKHKSTEIANKIDDENQIITLESCLKKYHTLEKLQDEFNCETCKIPRVHFKSLAAFRLPPILIIQLKRFKNMGGQYRKQSTTVEFPLHNLDMAPYLQDTRFMQSIGASTKYNLTGIINHYGSLTYGHYISVVKNPFSGKWYQYDDQNRKELNESQITKENAYILFYQRKDVDKKQILDLFPDSHVIFPGKPVTTRFGKGFVLGAKEGCSVRTYYVKIKGDVYEVPQTDLFKNKADKFIEMCENERSTLAVRNVQAEIDYSKASNISKFIGMFKPIYKPKVKDIVTEVEKLEEKQPTPTPPNQERQSLISPSTEQMRSDVISMKASTNNQFDTKKQSIQTDIKQSQQDSNFNSENPTTPLVQVKDENAEQRTLSFGGDLQDSLDNKDYVEIKPVKKKKKKKVKKTQQSTELMMLEQSQAIETQMESQHQLSQQQMGSQVQSSQRSGHKSTQGSQPDLQQ